MNKDRKGGLEGMTALLTDSKGSSVSKAAQLSPYSFPLQGLVGFPHRELWGDTIATKKKNIM